MVCKKNIINVSIFNALQVIWQETIDNFIEITGPFSELIENATTHTQMADATTVGFHYDMGNPIFSYDYFTGITKVSLTAILVT